MAKKYMSLQGKFYLAKLTAGVAGAMRHIGNVPEFELAIDSDIFEHQESTTGNRTTDFTLTQATTVSFSGQLEEVDKENMKYILSGTNHEITTETITDGSLGTVVVGQEIKLNGYKLTAVSFKDSTGSPVTVDAADYTLDAKFGTVIFTDVTGYTMPILATYTTGAVTNTTIADDFDDEYELFFKGINTATGDNIAVRLWRTKKSPATTFGLIHEELGQYAIEGNALSDTTKESDPELGLFGHVVTIPV